MIQWIQNRQWLPNILLASILFILLAAFECLSGNPFALFAVLPISLALLVVRRFTFLALSLLVLWASLSYIFDTGIAFSALGVFILAFLIAMPPQLLTRLAGLILCFLALVTVGLRLSQSNTLNAPASLVGSQIFLAITCLLLLFFLGRYTSLQINREPEMSLVAAVKAEAAHLSLRLAEQEQRFQIAREISEVVLQDVTAVLSQAEGGSYAAKVDPSAAERVLQRISLDARSAHQELRRLYSQLNRNLELQSAPPGIDDIEALVISLREYGYSATLTQSGNRFSITEGAELAIYRMIFDSLENIKQHVPISASVSIDFIWVEDGMQFLVKDNGIETLNRELKAKAEIAGEKFDGGYDIQTDIDTLVQPIVGLGITTMRERAALYGGSVDVSRVAGVGFTVSAIFPHLKATAGRNFNE